MKYTGLLVIVMIFGFGSSGNAFETDGFRSGMSVKEALLIARKLDPDVKVQDPSDIGRYMFMHPGGGRESSKRWSILFCDDRLVQIGRDYRFSWSAASKLISQLNRRYGEGSVRQWGYRNHRPDKIGIETGQPSSVGFVLSWESDKERVSVIMTLSEYKGEGPDGSQKHIKEESIIETYILKDDRCIYGPARRR